MPSDRVVVLALCILLMHAPLQAQDSTRKPVTQQPVQESALAFTANDPRLKWGPCPEFLPEGCGIAVLHGDPGKDNADIFFRVPAGADIPLHWHTSAERMVLVSGELQVSYAGQGPITLRPGSYAYGPARLPHHGRCADAGQCVLFIAFEGPVDAMPGGAPPK